MNIKTKTFYCILLFLFFLVGISFISLSIGPTLIPLKDLFNASFETIVWELRFRRILLAILVGGGLALSGNIFQIILRNPLADPYVLGVSSAAACGATIAIFLKLSPLWMSLFSLGGALTIILILSLAPLRYSGASSHLLLLTGVMLSFLFSSLVILFLSLAQPFEGAQLLFWLMGTLSQPISWEMLLLCAIAILLLGILAYRQSYSLNLLNLGDQEAQTLGLSVQTVKNRFFIMASLLTAICVSVSGTIGFVGLIIPHISRFLFGNDHRLMLPLSMLSGAIFLVISDTLIRYFSTQEIPIGVITAMLGAPCFLILLWKKFR